MASHNQLAKLIAEELSRAIDEDDWVFTIRGKPAHMAGVTVDVEQVEDRHYMFKFFVDIGPRDKEYRLHVTLNLIESRDGQGRRRKPV